MEALRPLMEQALESVRSGETPIVIAPTSYGKTRASPVIHRAIVEEGIAYGVIHVAPLRALVREVFTELFAPLRGGVQAYGLTGSEYKSPYLLRVPVAATIDSFLLNLYRLPVLEIAKIERGASRGHYYPALAAIKSSLNILDEAHLILDDALSPSDGYIALAAAIKALACSGARLAVETATLRPGVIAELVQLISVCSRVRILCLSCDDGDEYLETLKARIAESSGLKAGVSVEALQDCGFMEEYGIKWKTRIAKSWDQVLDEVKEQSSSEVTLVAVNTVDRAIKLYERLRDHGAVLIHGRLADTDREEAVKAVNSVTEKGYGIIVATQVIEAGVDVNASKVYTEAAPLEAIIQRAGRACRRGKILEECKSRGAEVVIIAGEDAISKSPYDPSRVSSDLDLIEKALSKSGIDWRLPCSSEAISYTRLLSASSEAGSPSRLRSLLEPLAGLYEAYLTSDATPDSILSILDDVGACSIYRSLSPIPLYAEGSGLIPVSLDLITRLNSWFWRVVERIDKAPVIVVLDEDGRVAAEAPLRGLLSLIKHGRVKCKDILKELLKAPLTLGLDKGSYTLAFKVKRDSYVKGVGLKTG